MNNLESEIKELEEKLLKHEVRADINQIENLLDDSFLEIGSSGSIYTKKDELNALPIEEKSIVWHLSDFQIKQIADDIVLALYKAHKRDHRTRKINYSMRSSLWKKTDNQWKVVFHQGTNIK